MVLVKQEKPLIVFFLSDKLLGITEHMYNMALSLSSLTEIMGGTSHENAKIILGILNGAHGPKRDVVLLNAAAALLTSEKVKSYKDALELSAYAIDSGKALEKLEELKNLQIKILAKS